MIKEISVRNRRDQRQRNRNAHRARVRKLKRAAIREFFQLPQEEKKTEVTADSPTVNKKTIHFFTECVLSITLLFREVVLKMRS